MAESDLHRSMKESASRQLAGEGYSIFEEPRFAPSRFMRWDAYRPDLFGVRAAPGRQDYALVECETDPSLRKLAAKNLTSIEVQTRLNDQLSLRLILVVPRGTLAKVDPSLRRAWETWIYECGQFQRFPKAEDRAATSTA